MNILVWSIAVEALVILLVAEILTRNIPRALSEAAEDNGFRWDGSQSPRRVRRERRARWKVRTDMWAVLLGVCLSGNAVLAVVHVYVIPLPLGLQAIGVFDPDVESWKAKLEANRVDARYEAWLDADPRQRNEDTLAARQLLWNSWPLVIIGLVVWFFVSLRIVAWAYNRTVRDFAAGIQRRGDRNLKNDLARLERAS